MQTKIRYDADSMKTMTVFSSVTGVHAKDIMKTDKLVTFVVDPGTLGRVLGKNAVNIRRLEGLLNRKIKIVEFNPSVDKFVANLILPMRAKQIVHENNCVIITGPDTQTKAKLIGRESSNLKQIKETVNRYFQIEDIKVV